MKNKLLIAGAGAGKTRFIINEALKYKDRKFLITTYTQENERSITQQFISINGCVPSNVNIQTWFSFLIQHGVKPFQGTFNTTLFDIDINGLILNNGDYGFKYIINGRKIQYSEDKDFMKHYFVGSTKILSDKLSKFVYHANKKTNGAIISRISKIFTSIFVDEVQDLAGYDLEILKLLFESSLNICLVGDPRQVTYLTSHYNKHNKYKDGKIKDYLNDVINIKKTPFEIDEHTLAVSHRNNQSICDFSTKIYPEGFEKINSCLCCRQPGVVHQGVFVVRSSDINEYLKTYNPIQLRYNKKSKVNEVFQFRNFGESKGLTFDRVLIYPTRKIENWLNCHDSPLKNSTRAKLYVAITRAKFSVAFVTDTEISQLEIFKPNQSNP